MKEVSERARRRMGFFLSNSACPALYVRVALSPALYSTTMPAGMSSAGGPASTSQESNPRDRAASTAIACPVETSTGVQSSRLSEVASRIVGTPQYIQYFPFTRVAMIRSPSSRLRIAPDFDSLRRCFPLAARANAGPCFVQLMSLRDVVAAMGGPSP